MYEELKEERGIKQAHIIEALTECFSDTKGLIKSFIIMM